MQHRFDMADCVCGVMLHVTVTAMHGGCAVQVHYFYKD